MGADEHMGVAEDELFPHILALAAALATGQDGDIDPGRRGGAMVRNAAAPKSSVGAINAAWRPPSITAAAASKATTVLLIPRLPAAAAAFGLGQIGDNLLRRASVSA